MADDSKKKQKGKHEAKEQRRKRQSRQQPGTERNQEKKPVTAGETAPNKPVYQPPGPEFYEGLKRETDEILKISEEENIKYRNKEIQSNWAKYEMPIDSYEEIDEQEQLGADYETLIQAPLSVGSHFQFKHEKSWDVTSGPSPYQKYFDINMGDLIVALSTIPFYERNSIEKTIFTDSDFQTMDQRATKYKHKYYNDMKYITPELEAQNNTISKLVSKSSEESVKTEKQGNHTASEVNSDNISLTFKDIKHKECEINVTNKSDDKTKVNIDEAKEINEIRQSDHISTVKNLESSNMEKCYPKTNIQNDPEMTIKQITDIKLSEVKLVDEVPVVISKESAEETIAQKEPSKPIIESPEDLEKWLDDFLDN